MTKEAADKLTGEHVVIPDGYTEIDGGAFENREDITSMVIPNSVTTIGEGTFFGCRNRGRTRLNW